MAVGSPLLSLQLRGTQQPPQQGNAPMPRKFSILKCSPTLWGSGRKEVQAPGLSPPRYTLTSTAKEGCEEQLLSPAPGGLQGSGSQTCSGGVRVHLKIA